MQRSLAASLRSLRLLQHHSATRAQSKRWLSAGAGDPSIHSQDPQEEDADEATKSASAERQVKERRSAAGKSASSPSRATDFTTDHKSSSPFVSTTPRLESSEVVGPTVDPTFQQKRRAHSAAVTIDDVSCVGWDGAPLRGNDKGFERKLKETEEKEEEEVDDYKEYYAEHKPSPLAEVEVADTRKPITAATDGSAQDVLSDGGTYMVEDTVDAALARAEKIFRENAVRGDPDMPHSRALRRMLMERAMKSGGRNENPWAT